MIRSRRSSSKSSAATTSRRRLRPFGWTVVGLLAALLAAAIWVGWTWWGSALLAGDKGRVAASAAQASWSASPAPASAAASAATPGAASSQSSGPAEGQLVAVMRIPRLGDDWKWPVYASTAEADTALNHGLAWYRGTALPGQIGNFAVAGRSATGANAFRYAERLRAGDEVIVETASAIYTYRIDVPFSGLSVDSSADWVLDPVPGHPDADAQQPLLTLTTNQDVVPTDSRSVAVGHLVQTRNRIS